MTEVVSFRVTAEEKKRLAEMAQRTGLPVGDVVRAMLADPKIQELIDNAYDEGEAEGYGKVYLPCVRCRKLILFNLSEPAMKRKLEEAFAQWGHTECVNPRKV